jgi:hypothetical protein
MGRGISGHQSNGRANRAASEFQGRGMRPSFVAGPAKPEHFAGGAHSCDHFLVPDNRTFQWSQS